MLRAPDQHRSGIGLTITPGIRAGLDMLRLSPHDLTERLRVEGQANPLLIVEVPPKSTLRGGRRSSDVADLAVSAPNDLYGSLRAQIGTMAIAPDVRALADYLAGTLDSRGFLTKSRAELAVETRFPLSIVDGAIDALTQCDPAGIGARNLQQCLALQLRRQGMPAARAEAVVSVFELLMTGDWPRAQAELGGSVADMEALAAQLYALDVDPAAAFVQIPDVFLVPDLQVGLSPGGRAEVTLIDDWMPRLSVDRILRIQGQQDSRMRDFVEDRVRSAEGLMRAVEFRQRTILDLGQYLVRSQADFFEGRSALPHPLTRSEAAAALGVHPSTVGRTVQGRALEFAGRVQRLNWFFPRKVDQHEGDGLSLLAVHDLLRHLVASEAPGTPLTDLILAERLRDAGVDISRRTVAKYRDAMNIPPSHIRRRLASGPSRRAT